MDKSCKDRLFACRTYAEAKPILETIGVGPSAHELAYTAFSIADKQPRLRDQFLGTVMQEADEAEAKKEDTDKRDPLKDKPIKEADGGTSHQSSNLANPIPHIGNEQSAPEGADAQPDKKDQMGVAINEMAPMPMQPQQPMQQAPPPMGGMGMPPQQPPMMPPPAPKPPTPQQQMQYTIQETVRAMAGPYINRLTEAIKVMDKKIQEVSKESVKTLELGSGIKPHMGRLPIRETVGEDKGTIGTELENKRRSIQEIDDAMNSGIYK